MSKHQELKKTFKPGQQWQFNDLRDTLGWEDCYNGSEPMWYISLEYRIKPIEETYFSRSIKASNYWKQIGIVTTA